MRAIENDDTDGDGFTNLVEINAGTSPGDQNDFPGPPPPPANNPPTANAGPNQTVEAGSGGTASVTLNGNGSSDPDAGDSIASYSWSGPFGTATGATPTVSLGVGTHTITLTVQDTNGGSDTDTVVVTVNAATPVNGAPSASNDSYSVDAGSTLGLTAPGVLGNDNDPDNDSLTAVLASGPSSGTFNLSSNGSFNYTPSIASGSATFTYRASDGSLTSNVATVTITVNAGTSTNNSPTANAGPDQTVEADAGGTASVTLNGNGSSDPDPGDSIASYSWSGPFGTATGATPSVTLGVGSHTITLTVQDTNGASDTDTVQVTVNPAPTAVLTGLTIGSPTEVNENSSTNYTATASWSDGTTSNVTANAAWSVDTTTYASISAGVLETSEVPGDQTVTVSVSYSSGVVTETADIIVTIVDVPGEPPPPGNLSVLPQDGDVGIPVSTAVMITLNGSAADSIIDEPSDIRTIVNNDTFTLRANSPVAEAQWYRDRDDHQTQCVTNGIVNGKIDYNESNTEAWFTPDCRLANSTRYTATVILSQEADPLTWSFTTIATTPDSDDDGVEDGEDDEADDDKEATPPKSKGKGKFRYRLRNHESAYLRNVGGISDTHYSINQTGKPVGYEFPDGLVDAEIHDVAPGETVDVELTLTEAVPEGSKVYMADAAGFREVPAVISGDTVTLTLSGADVGNGDVPPIGVAVPNATGDGSIGVATDAAGGGCSVVGGGGGWKEAAGSYGLLTLVWLGLALRRRKPETGR